MSFNQSKYANEFAKEKYDRLNIQVPKGRKSIIEAHWKGRGYKSLNAYVNDLIERDMRQEKTGEDHTANVHVETNSGIVIGNNSGAIHMKRKE